jgi:hypothetical protein
MKRASATGWALPLLLAAIVASVGLWADAAARKVVEGRVRDELRVALESNARAMELWMQAEEATARRVAENARIVAIATQLRGAGGTTAETAETLRARPEQEEFRRLVTSLALARGQGGASLEGVLGAALTDTTGRILASIDLARIGLRHQAFDDEAILRVLAGEALMLRPMRVPSAATAGASARGDIQMSLTAPVRDERGDVIAVLAIRLRPEAEFTRMLNSSRFGDSGETYAFDARVLALSESRFPEQLRSLGLIPQDPAEGAILNLHLRDPGGDMTRGFRPSSAPESWPVSRAVTDGLAGHTGVDTTGYRDYRGVTVVGAWSAVERHGLGLIVKLDRDEAYSGLTILRRAFGALLGLLALSGVGLAAYTRMASRLGRDLRRARKLGHYTLEEKVGEGGMGAVYRARHALLRRSTAIKLIRAGRANPQMLVRFEREVQLTSQLTHPNTIAVFDYGRSGDGTFYYAMEYLDGVTLDRLVAGEGPLEARRALHILKQICGSLAEAHALGLIHRDIKPANVMLCVRGLLYDFVKVLDFGLAKEAAGSGGGDVTSVGELTGTPLYMAPEMIKAPDGAGPASDVYAVGALAYYLVAGAQVFTGSSVVEILGRHLNEAPVPPSERSGRPLDPGLERLVLRCLEKDRARRPADARELLAELEKLGAGERPWTQAEARAWWETRGEAFRRTTTGAAPTGAPELEIELLDRISGTGGAVDRGDSTRTYVAPAPGKVAGSER